MLGDLALWYFWSLGAAPAIPGSASCCTSSPGEGVPSEVQPQILGRFTGFTTGLTRINLAADVLRWNATRFRLMEQVVWDGLVQPGCAGCTGCAGCAQCGTSRIARETTHVSVYYCIAHFWCVWCTWCSCLCRAHFSDVLFFSSSSWSGSPHVWCVFFLQILNEIMRWTYIFH